MEIHKGHMEVREVWSTYIHIIHMEGMTIFDTHHFNKHTKKKGLNLKLYFFNFFITKNIQYILALKIHKNYKIFDINLLRM